MALDCGISPFLFWEMSIKEIVDLIESKNRTELARKKEQAIFNQVLAIQISERVGCLLAENSEDVKLTKLWNFFPEMFESEKESYIQQKEIDEFERFKANRRAFASRHNRKGGH